MVPLGKEDNAISEQLEPRTDKGESRDLIELYWVHIVYMINLFKAALPLYNHVSGTRVVKLREN